MNKTLFFPFLHPLFRGQFPALFPALRSAIVTAAMFSVSYSVAAQTEQISAIPQALIPAQSYQLGCSPADKECDRDEGINQQGKILPVTVTVPAFKIDKYETSVAEYRECVEAGVCSKPFDFRRTHYCNYDAPGRDNYPQNCINWFQAKNYCEWRGKRLAYDVEWEAAARAGARTAYPWGTEPASCDNAVMDPGHPSKPDTVTDGCWRDLSWPRNSFKANAYGLHDMIGGTAEWLMDWYHPQAHKQYYAKGQYTGPDSGSLRVIKGGAWDEEAWAQRVSNRFAKPQRGNPDLYGSNGIRCVEPVHGSLK